MNESSAAQKKEKVFLTVTVVVAVEDEKTDPRKVEAQVDGSRDAEQSADASSAPLRCNLLALDTAGAARGSLLFPNSTRPSTTNGGPLHPPIGSCGRSAASRQCRPRAIRGSRATVCDQGSSAPQ